MSHIQKINQLPSAVALAAGAVGSANAAALGCDFAMGVFLPKKGPAACRPGASATSPSSVRDEALVPQQRIEHREQVEVDRLDIHGVDFNYYLYRLFITPGWP